MINYRDGYCAVHTLFRVNGSAAYKSFLYAVFSCAVYYLIYDPTRRFEEDETVMITHPYTIAALVAAFMLLLSTKVTFSYNRFWEACTSLHNMQSKWLDCCQTLAAYHLQSSAYDSVRPACFGEHGNINDLLLERERGDDKKTSSSLMEGIMERVKTAEKAESSPNQSFGKFLTKEFRKTCKRVGLSSMQNINQSIAKRGHKRTTSRSMYSYDAALTAVGSGDELLPSLFLQESAHLISLLSAVALATLRNEIEGMDAPLCEFVPGKAWPTYNSNKDPDMKEYGYRQHGCIRSLRYVLDISRTPEERAAYNMARPFPVIGGVSEKEARFLQQARGPTAKVTLVNFWLNEFVIREHLHGSTGDVGPPIISRIQQYQSDGFMWYNSARKMSYIPFPFPHSQITTLFCFLAMFLIPLLMLSFASFWLGLVFNFFTITLFVGLNEVSKELEYPYRCMPNDLPLNLFQAQINEALLTTFAGFHPDSDWEVAGAGVI